MKVISPTLRDSLLRLLVQELLLSGGEIVLSGRVREALSDKGLTRADLHWVINHLVRENIIEIETGMEGIILRLIARIPEQNSKDDSE